MSNHRSSWAIPLGIAFGVVLGVVVSKLMDHWALPARADSTDGRKALVEQAASFRSAAKTAAPAVVAITTVARVRYQEGGGIDFDRFGAPFYKRPRIKEGQMPRGIGSGFVFDAAKGYILTNNHVVKDGDSFVVRLADKRELDAKLVGTDPQTDLAVLKVDAAGLSAAPLGDSDTVEVGDWVLAVGNPFGFLEQTVTAGIISAKGRRGMHLSNYEDYLQTDAAINQGNSGGPLVNVNGEVIGVNTAIISGTGGYQGVAFAIPINQAKKIASHLVASGAVVRGWMGVQVDELRPEEAKRLGMEGGAVLSGVFVRGPAHTAGLLPGDVLVKLDGKPVHSANDIRDTVAGMAPGAKVTLVVRRKDENKSLDVTLGQQPKDWGVNKE